MNRKGFTLTEVLVVIAIISVLMLIAIPSVLTINRRIDKRLFESKKDLIMLAGEQYGNDNKNKFISAEDKTITITVNELIQLGYLTPDKDKANKCDKKLYSGGCVFNPEDDLALNEVEISLVLTENNIVMAYWNEGAN